MVPRAPLLKCRMMSSGRRSVEQQAGMPECYRTRQSRRNLRTVAPADGASAWISRRGPPPAAFPAPRPASDIPRCRCRSIGCDPVQVILRLLAVALFDLPQAVILPGLDVGGIGLQRALVPDLRHLVVAELAVGVADQIGDGGAVVAAERLQLRDRARIVAAVKDRGVGSAVPAGEGGVLAARFHFRWSFSSCCSTAAAAAVDCCPVRRRLR